jgi:hypothetical protein
LFDRALALDPASVWGLIGIATVDLRTTLGFLVDDRAAQFAVAEAAVVRARAGGCRGLQTQVLLSGIYYINPMFVQAELVDPTEVPIGNAGSSSPTSDPPASTRRTGGNVVEVHS